MYKDPDEWVEAITILDDDKIYREYSERAKIYSRKFKIQKTIQEFKELLEHELDLRV